MKAKEMRAHITTTYISLRMGMVVLAIALPLMLWLGGFIRAGLPLQGSMSAYYHSGDGAMRDVFVGVLVAVGAILCLYKGFTSLEDWALNLAGAFVVGVALFPMEWECGTQCRSFTLHGTFAVLFFLCIAYVCLFRASDTLRLVADDTQRKRYKNMYKLLGVGLITSPAIAVLLTFVFQAKSDERSTIFFVEAVGVLMFALYWLVKSGEIKSTDAEQLALKGKLRTDPFRGRDLFRQIPVDRTERSPKQ